MIRPRTQTFSPSVFFIAFGNIRHERDLALKYGCIKDVELAEKPRGERQTGERDHPDQHREREKWRALCKTIEVGNFFAGLLRDNY